MDHGLLLFCVCMCVFPCELHPAINPSTFYHLVPEQGCGDCYSLIGNCLQLHYIA